MINLSKVTNTKVNLQKANRVCNSVPRETKQVQTECNLNMLAPSYCIPSDNFQKAKLALSSFYEEYGEVKSSTYICEKIKQAQRANNTELADELFKLRLQYSQKVKKLRKAVNASKFSTRDEYILALKSYIKENGAYMNCQECADLMCYDLNQKGVKSNNIFLYTVNDENNRTSKAEHVFTVVGLDKNASNDPSTWGNCYIVDAWSGICLPYKQGIEFYQEFFDLDSEKHKLMFEIM